MAKKRPQSQENEDAVEVVPGVFSDEAEDRERVDELTDEDPVIDDQEEIEDEDNDPQR